MKIVIIQSGPAHEVLILASLLIGISKKYRNSTIIWVGEPAYFDILKYNKRISEVIDITQGVSFSALASMYDADICVNTCLDKHAREFASLLNGPKIYGFSKESDSRESEFFLNIIKSNLTTNKTILDLYYGLAGLEWKGEGYGLSYYPRSRQKFDCGYYSRQKIDNCRRIDLPSDLLQKFDVLNRYAHIITDDLFTLHASLSLRKEVTFTSKLPYRIEFFGKGRVDQGIGKLSS